MRHIFFTFFGLLFWGLGQTQTFNYPFCKDYILKNDLPSIDKIEAHFLEGIQLATQKGYPDTIGLLWHKLGVAFYKKRAIDKAIKANRNAIVQRQALLQIDTFGLSRSLFNMGMCHKQTSDLDSTMHYFQKVIALGANHINDRFTNACFEIGKQYNSIGDFKQAAQYLQLGEQYLIAKPTLSGKKKRTLAQLYLEQGNNFNSMKQSKHAIEKLEAAIPLYEELERETSKYLCLNGIGSAYEELGQLDKAVWAYREALNFFRKEEMAEQSIALLNNLSIVLINSKKYAEAERLLNEAIFLATEVYGDGRHIEKASMYDNMGDLRLQQGKHLEALKQYQEAIFHAVPGFNPKSVHEYPDAEALKRVFSKNRLLIYLADKAACLQQYALKTKNNDFAEMALEAYYLIDKLIDQMQKEQDVRASRLFWRQEAHQLYEAAIATCYHLHEYEGAFHFFEKSKAALLLDALLEANARQLIPDSISREVLKVVRNISEMGGQLEVEPHNNGLRRELIKLQTKRADLYQYIETAYPQYYRFRYGQQLMALDTLKVFCQRNRQMMIHFFYGEKRVYVFSIDVDGGLDLKQLQASPKEINSIVGQFLEYFKSAQAITNDPTAYATVAYELYEMLLASTLSKPSAQKTNQLILSLDGPLHYIPFEALIDQKSEGVDRLGQLSYLVRTYEMACIYSMTTLFWQGKLSASKDGDKRKVLAFAPFTSNKTVKWPELKASAIEIQLLKKLFKGQYYHGEQARLEYFLEQASNFSVIHLSTHASAGNAEEVPYIVFSDSVLYLQTLYGLSLHANLIVLSACQTNIGDFLKGEGVMSLSSGFAYAGMQSMVSSLWNANDVATAQLFSQFYKELDRGVPKIKALQKAKLHYLSQPDLTDAQKSPYYWAGFIYIGSDGSLDMTTAHTPFLALCLIILAFIGIVGYWYSKKRVTSNAIQESP